ncbi:MAG: hypothetical protein Q9157_006184, partial [Trypethelium eluteriae]
RLKEGISKMKIDENEAQIRRVRETMDEVYNEGLKEKMVRDQNEFEEMLEQDAMEYVETNREVARRARENATSNVVLLRKDDVPGSSTAVSLRGELQAVAYKLFARDQRPHDVEFLRITPDGAEPIDSNLWNGGFYFRQVDGTTSLVLIDVNLTLLIHPEVNRDSNSDAQSAKTNSSHNSWQADGSLSKMGDSVRMQQKKGGKAFGAPNTSKELDIVDEAIHRLEEKTAAGEIAIGKDSKISGSASAPKISTRILDWILDFSPRTTGSLEEPKRGKRKPGTRTI